LLIAKNKDTDLLWQAKTCTKFWLKACRIPNFMNTILVSILIPIHIPTNGIVRISLARLQKFYPCSSANLLVAEMKK
jgi:hypothetical protein